jgi:hypothetical protein
MDRITSRLVIGLGLIAAGQYVLAPYIPSNGDGPDSPPAAALSSLATSTSSSISYGYTFVFDAITDAEYANVAPAAGLTVTPFSKV